MTQEPKENWEKEWMDKGIFAANARRQIQFISSLLTSSLAKQRREIEERIAMSNPCGCKYEREIACSHQDCETCAPFRTIRTLLFYFSKGLESKEDTE